MKKLIGPLLVLVVFSACQTMPTTPAPSMSSYATCMTDNAELACSTKEDPYLVADAAHGACLGHFGRYEEAVRNYYFSRLPSGHRHLTSEKTEIHLLKTEKQVKSVIISELLECRRPR